MTHPQDAESLRLEVERLRGVLRGECNLGLETLERAEKAEAEVARLTDAIAREEKAHDVTISQRDRAEAMADKLARAIGGDAIGEHSNANCPWSNALDMASSLTADLATSRAETAMAFEVAAAEVDSWFASHEFNPFSSIRALTPADATAALAARDKAKDDRISELRAEVVRRSEMHECAMAERDDCILDWSDTKAERDRLAAEVERLTAERDAALAGAVKVRPLVWEDADEGMCTKWRAIALGGSYDLVELDKDDGLFSVMFHWGRPLSFWFIQDCPDEFGRPSGPKKFPTLEAAKAAAQADYGARILSSIQPDTEAVEMAEAVAFSAGYEAAQSHHGGNQ